MHEFKTFNKIGVIGISMGGWIIERAIINENVDFMLWFQLQQRLSKSLMNSYGKFY